MRIIVISMYLISALADSPANSDTMYEVGRKACNAVLLGQEPTFGEKYYLRFAELIDLDHEELCEGVGIEFTRNTEERAAVMDAAGSAGEAQSRQLPTGLR